jgi:hypothetical protein
VIFLNIDWVVIPALRKAHICGLRLFLAASVMSTAELIFWYWFWGWLLDAAIHAKKVQESIAFGKQIKNELIEEGYIERIKKFFINKLNGALESKSRIVRIIKAGGAFSMILAGITPEPGGRFIGIVFCRSAHWRRGFYFLALGNILHICYIVGGWSIIFHLFERR